MKNLILGAALLVLNTVDANAQPDTVVLRSGKTVSGTVVESETDSEAVTLRFPVEGGDGTITLKEEQVVPASWYRIQARVGGESAASRLVLADYCIRNGLYFQAERELSVVRSLDAALAPQAEELIQRARALGANRLLGLATEALAEEDLAKAMRLVSTIRTRYADAPDFEEAGRLLDRIEAARQQQRVAVAERSQQRRDRQEEQGRRKLLDRVTQHLEDGNDRNLKGLKVSSGSRSVAYFKSAISHQDKALATLDTILEKQGNDRVLADRLEELRSEVVVAAIEAHINLGSSYLVRGSYVNALQHANHAIAVDSRNSYARQFRARVEIAAAEAASGRWRVR